jgi:hypothetical protein
MPYVVKARRKHNNQVVVSRVYRTKAEAQKHVSNTKTGWSNMFKNPRIKKI